MVSLIMPVWKPNPIWLREAVESALEERACPIELIVVDDGSPDPVARLLEGIDDPRLRVVEVEHGGVSHARNEGLRTASGEAVRFVDSDDVVEPGSTTRLLELSGDGEAIAYGSTLVCDPLLRPEKLIEASVEGDALVACLLGDFFVYITAILFPRAVVDAVGGFDTGFSVNEDYDYVLRALEHAPVRGGGFVATRYRRHDDSITARAPGESRGRDALEALFVRRPDLRGTRLERAARAHSEIGAASRLMREGRYLSFLRGLGRAMRLSPRRAAPESAAAMAALPRLLARRALSMGRRPAA
jgi:glycosyltransferase involved in cell wall biosynthesis